MTRPRDNKNKSLPPNLYFNKIKNFYQYRRPDNGKRTALGKDRAKAVSAAKKLNSILMPGEDLVAMVLTEGKTLAQYIQERFIPTHLPEREISENTFKAYLCQINNICKKLGNYPIHKISIKNVSDFLITIKGTRQSNKYRGLLSIIFDYARGEGYIETNPAKDTLKRREKKKRHRLNHEAFIAIHKLAGKKGLKWFQDCMDFNLLTLQRREEIAHAKFEDITTEMINGQSIKILKVIQKKTRKYGESAYIKIIVNKQLEQFIEQRKNTGINSPFIIYRIPNRIAKIKAKDREHHTQLMSDDLSRTFAKIRDETDLFDHLEKEEKPTFHEIRSLAIKLHEDKGFDAQALAGHTTRQMTEAYKKGHEIEWTYAKAAHIKF